ncbi:MAG TPA: mechanosensitive ion channel family protein, partial [Planctomycetota bacterium]|nr:mechanosensitive ion channel family protein [Planctomycetota bacterium]
SGLGTLITRATWLAVLGIGAGWLGLSTDVSATIFLALRVYLILAIGVLVWRSIDAMIESLDALSRKYSEPDNALRHYDKVRHLVPLLRRCIEYVLIVFVVTLALEEVDWVAEYAVWGPRIIRIIGIVFASRVLVEVLNLAVDEVLVKRSKLPPEQRQRRATIVPLIESSLKYIVYVNAAFLVLGQLGIDPTPFLAGAGIVGLAIGLGAQGLVNDMVSGFFILFEDYYLVGDYIAALAAEGTVERIDLRTTRIRDTSGRLHILRNGQIESVVNYSKVYTFAVVDVGAAYETDLDRAYAALERCGERLGLGDGNVLEATRVMGLQAFGESELTLRTVTRVKPGSHLQVERALRKIIKEVFDEEGIEIPYARRVLILQNGVCDGPAAGIEAALHAKQGPDEAPSAP